MTKYICKDKNAVLCDSCIFEYPVCGGKDNNVDFGTGLGFDNITECDGYEPEGELPEDVIVINE